MNSQVLRCPNCGGNMTIDSSNIADKKAVCPYCRTTIDIPDDNIARVIKRETKKKGLFRGSETIEEVTEMRADDASVPPPQIIQFQVPARRPAASSSSSSGMGCVIGMVVLIGGIILGTVFLITSTTKSVMKSVSDSINSSVSSVTGGDKTTNIESERSYKSDVSFGPDHVAYSPDGTVLVGLDSSNLTLWDTQSGAVNAHIEANFSFTGGTLAFSGTSVMANDGGKITYYDLQNGHIVRQLGDNNYSTFALSPDGKLIAAPNWNAELFIISTDSGNEIRQIPSLGDRVGITGLYFSPDSRYLVVTTSDGQAVVWDTTTWQEIFNKDISTQSLDYVAFEPNQDTLVVAGRNTLDFYNVDGTGLRYLETQTINDDFFVIQGLVFSPDGKEIVMGNFFGKAWVWNINKKKITAYLDSKYGVDAVAFSPDGALVAGTGGEDVLEWQLHDHPVSTVRAEPTEVPPPTAAVQPVVNNASKTSACTISAESARIRSIPSTDGDVKGTLSNATGISVDKRANDAAGYQWWHLADGRGWVREDVVNEQGSCDSLPLN